MRVFGQDPVGIARFGGTPGCTPLLQFARRHPEVQLAPGWSYKLSAPIDIDAGGGCSEAQVDLIRANRVILHLQGSGASCRFSRVLG